MRLNLSKNKARHFPIMAPQAGRIYDRTTLAEEGSDDAALLKGNLYDRPRPRAGQGTHFIE